MNEMKKKIGNNIFSDNNNNNNNHNNHKNESDQKIELFHFFFIYSFLELNFGKKKKVSLEIFPQKNQENEKFVQPSEPFAYTVRFV